jgi:hypothetical protein
MSKRENQKWMEDLFTRFQECFWAGEFAEVDSMLENHTIEGTPRIRNIAMVRGSFAARKKLKNWVPYRDRLYAHLKAQGEDADRLMRGLMDTSWAD